MPYKNKAHFLPFVGYFVLVALTNWPLIININTHIVGRTFEDAFEVLWLLWWMEDAVIQQRVNPFYSPDIFYPVGWHIASGAQPGWFMLLLAPFTRVAGNVVAYNFTLLSTFVAGGFGVYLLVYQLTQQRLAAFLAGAVYITAPVLTVRMGGHLHTLFSMAFLPYATLSFYQVFSIQQRDVTSIVRTGILLALTILGHWYFLFIATIPLVVLSAFIPKKAEWREWGIRLILIDATTLILVLPFVLLTWSARRAMFPESGDFSLAASDIWGVSLDYLFAPNPNHPLWGDWLQRYFPVTGEHSIVSTGYTALVLAIIGLLFGQRQQTRPFVFMALVSLLLAMGPILQWHNARFLLSVPEPIAPTVQRLYPEISLPPDRVAVPLPGLFLYYWMPFFASVRVWARFVIPLILALAVLAGYGGTLILNRGWKWRFLLLLMLVLVVLEGLPAPYRAFTEVSQNDRSVNQWLAEQPAGATLIEYPRPWVDKLAMYSQSLHGQRVVNGYMSVEPDFLRHAAHQLGTWPDAEALDLLQQWQVQYIVISGVDSQEFAEILARIDRLPGLCHVQTFEDGFMHFTQTHLYVLRSKQENCSNSSRSQTILDPAGDIN